MTPEEHPPAPDCPTCGESMKVHPSGWGRWFCMNGHWAGTTDEELRASRIPMGDSPTVSEPRTEDDLIAWLRSLSPKGVAAIEERARAEAAQPIDVTEWNAMLQAFVMIGSDPDVPYQYRRLAKQHAARLRASDTDQ